LVFPHDDAFFIEVLPSMLKEENVRNMLSFMAKVSKVLMMMPQVIRFQVQEEE